MKIVVTGSIAYDYLMTFPGKFADNFVADQLDKISVSFLVKEMVKKRGGTAPNIAYTLAMLGGSPSILATAGQDFGEYRAFLNESGVDTSTIITVPDKFTASFFANTDTEQNQIASFYAGAMENAADLTFAEHAPDTDLAIISPNEPAAMNNHALECKELGIDYIYDPSQQTIWLTAEDLINGISGCRILTVNEYEIGMIKDKTGWDEDKIMSEAGGLLVTKGKDGSTLLIDGERYDFPVAPPRQVAEPTGAGDAFRAGLMRSMQLGLPWDVAGRVAALCSTYVIELTGTQSHSYTPQEFVARYRESFDDNGALDALLA